MNTARRRTAGVFAVLIVLMAMLAVTAPTVGAVVGGYETIIPIDTVVRAEAGTKTLLASEDVPEEFLGQSCEVISEGLNQESIHPGNDVVVESGSSQVLLEDVEATPDAVVFGDGPLVLGSTITVSLIMGDDRVFSAGLNILIDCTPIHPTDPPVVDVSTSAECTLDTFQFVISVTNTGAVDVDVQFVWDSGALSETLSLEETLSQVIPADESYTIEVFGPDEEKIHRETGDAESCDQVSPTSITSPPTTAEVLPTSITSAPSTTAEVLASDTLPFTGADSGTPALLALALIGIGALALVATRRAED